MIHYKADFHKLSFNMNEPASKGQNLVCQLTQLKRTACVGVELK